jgi:hypothetical protein
MTLRSGYASRRRPGTLFLPKLLSTKTSGGLGLEESRFGPEGRFCLLKRQPVVLRELRKRLSRREPEEDILGADTRPRDDPGSERATGIDDNRSSSGLDRAGPPADRERVFPPLDLVQVTHHRLGERLLSALDEVHEVDVAAIPFLVFREELNAVREDPLCCKWMLDLHPSPDVVERLPQLLHRDALLAKPCERQDLDEVDEREDRERFYFGWGDDRACSPPPAAGWIGITSDPIPQGLGRYPREPGRIRNRVERPVEAGIGRVDACPSSVSRRAYPSRQPTERSVRH